MPQKVNIDELVRLCESKYTLFVSIARRYAPAPDLVYDIVQQAFVDFLKSLSEKDYTFDGDLTPLIVQITKNRALLSWREKRRNSSEVMEAIARRFHTIQTGGPDEEIVERSADEMNAMNACVQQLPPKSRDWVRMHYMDGQTMDQIGKQNNMRPGTVRQAFTRIRIRLRKCIESRLNQTKEIR